MRNFAKLLGIIAMVAVIGFSMTACGEEEEEDVVVRFDSALYGSWYNDIFNLTFRTSPVTGNDVLEIGMGDNRRLTAKNGNTYTCDSLVFTAVVGSDGKLTISGWTGSNNAFNGTYTKY